MEQIVIDLLSIAKEKEASDLHFTVGIPPKMRVNGELMLVGEQYARMMPDDTKRIAEGILNEKQLKTLEERGAVDLSFSVPSMGRFRLNVFKQRGSYALAIRLVAPEVPSPQELGIPDAVMQLTEKKHGLILVTGPTGCGKTTTLASLIDTINKTREAHVITLEDPIEYLHRHDKSIVNQREIGLDATSYADALRSTLREDPDVILVGEMRDYDTISIAVRAAETGHLVLSTLHTIGAASTVDRIIEIFPPYQQQQIRVQVANVLEAVISQQLIPTADGQDRAAAFEVMLSNSAVRNLIRESKSYQLGSVIETNRASGMITMDEAILDLVRSGRITKEMALQFSQNPEQFENRLKSV